MTHRALVIKIFYTVSGYVANPADLAIYARYGNIGASIGVGFGIAPLDGFRYRARGKAVEMYQSQYNTIIEGVK